MSIMTADRSCESLSAPSGAEPSEPREMDEKSEVIEMTADIVSAYVGNNTVAAADLPSLIQSVHRALAGV